ncbi:MAG: ABC transporter ATP-binding protein [Pseudomonadota bacterium]
MTLTDAAPVLRLTGITKRFGPLVANNAVNLHLGRGEVLALLGENGAGKSTLMSILFGHYTADEGTVEVANESGSLTPLRAGSPAAALEAGVGMVHQHFTLADNLSVLDNITLGTEGLWRAFQSRAAARRRLNTLMEDSGLTVPLERPVGNLSVGEQQRTEILKALYRGVRILVLDEPTAVLTPQEVNQLFDTLRRLTEHGLSIIFISHKLDEVTAISDRVAILRSGVMVGERETKSVDRGELAELMVGHAVELHGRDPQPRGDEVARLDTVSVPGPRGGVDLKEADLTLCEREIVGIAGVSGNGQGALAALLSGLAHPSDGSFDLFGSPVSRFDAGGFVADGVGRIPEDRHRDGTVGDMTVWENAILETYRDSANQRAGWVRIGAARDHAKRLIEAFDVRCPGPDAPIRLLSGGNMQKLIIGRVLENKPRLIIANQPTRGLDIGAVAFVQDRLLEAKRQGAAILLISEDLDELFQIADRLAVIHGGHLSEAKPTEDLTKRQVGLMMAGEGQGAHAA